MACDEIDLGDDQGSEEVIKMSRLRSVGRYSVEDQTIGKGNFAVVELATHTVTKTKVGGQIKTSKWLIIGQLAAGECDCYIPILSLSETKRFYDGVCKYYFIDTLDLDYVIFFKHAKKSLSLWLLGGGMSKTIQSRLPLGKKIDNMEGVSGNLTKVQPSILTWI